MKEKPELWKRAPRLKRTVRESTLSLSSRTFLARAHAGIRRRLPVLLSSLAVAPARKCVVSMLFRVWESPSFFRQRDDYAHARLSLVATPFRTLPASVMIMARSRKSEFNFPSWPDTSNGFNKWRNRVHARIKLEEIITPEFRSND